MIVLAADVMREKEAGRTLDAFTATLHPMSEGLSGQPGPSGRRSFHRDILAALAHGGALQRSIGAG